MKMRLQTAPVVLAWAALAASPASLAAQPETAPTVAEVMRAPAQALIAKAGSGDKTLRSLLADGFEIIHVDAPAGSLAARFILRKGLDIYSCEQAVYREGSGEGGPRVIAAPCLLLTPNE